MLYGAKNLSAHQQTAGRIFHYSRAACCFKQTCRRRRHFAKTAGIKKLDKDQNTIKAIIDKLEKNGFAVRIQNAKDKRAFTLFMTEYAKNLLPVFYEIDKQCIQTLCTGLSESEIAHLSDLLKIIRENSNK